MAPRCSFNVRSTTSYEKESSKKSITLSRRKRREIENTNKSTTLLNPLKRRKYNVSKEILSLLKRRLAMIGLKTDFNTTSITTNNPLISSLPSSHIIPHYIKNINYKNNINNKVLKRTKYINSTTDSIVNSVLKSRSNTSTKSNSNNTLNKNSYQTSAGKSPILEASTLSVNSAAATTVGPSLFISSSSSVGHVVQTTTSAAAAAAALTSAVTHDVATSSVSSTVTEAPVTEFPWASGDEALFLLLLNQSGSAVLGGATNGTVVRLCSDWVPAQNGLFQAANLFFAVAFLVPRSFRQSILLLRTSLAVGFCVSALWAALTICAADIVAWSATLSLVNAAHAVRLALQFLPPRLSPDLLELYERLFGPLKVEKQHFKEMTREGRLMRLEPGDTYAVEDVTPADDRLGVLLSGKLRVTCDQTYLHFISPQQFVDSPEWEAARTGPNHVFQVTITAEETSVCLCWSKPRLENLFRLRPLLEVIMLNLIGKDITHKLYSMNEHLLSAAGALAEQHVNAAQATAGLPAEAVHWSEARGTSAGSENMMLHRSLSVDAVHTGSRGHVRSLAWRARQQRRVSLVSDPTPPAPQMTPGVTVFPLQHQASPIRKANHFPATSPFTHQFRRRPTPSWARPPPMQADTCFSYSPNSAQQGSNLGPSYFSYPAVQQPLAASGLLVEPPLGVTPSPIMAAMAASVGGLLRLPPHAPSHILSSNGSATSNSNNANNNSGARKEVTFEEDSV